MKEKSFETIEIFPQRPPIMPGAEPIFIHQNEVALLFLHGFTGSSYEGRDFAAYFAGKGYSVGVPLLPGHGTLPADLEDIPYQKWLEAAEQYYREMKAKFKHVLVCGQSMGGALALHLAANYPLEGVVSLAGAVFVKDWRLNFLPLAKRFIRYYYKSKGPDIRDKMAKARCVTYHKYPIKSLVQFLDLLDFVKTELPKVTCPCLLIHSRKDHTITYENLEFISKRASSRILRTITLENSYHVISVDEEKKTVFETIENFLLETVLNKKPSQLIKK